MISLVVVGLTGVFVAALLRMEYAPRIAEWEAWDDLSRQARLETDIRPTRPVSAGSYGVDAAFMSLQVHGRGIHIV